MSKKMLFRMVAALATITTLFGFKKTIQQENMMQDTQKSTLSYLVRKPKVKTAKTPLVVLMHGVGSNEQNMFSYADAMPGNFLVVSPRGPLTLGNGSYAWFQVQFTQAGPVINAPQAEAARTEIIKFIKGLKSVEDFDEHQVYLFGFSQGGIMSYSVALTEPEMIKGIAVMSGRLLPEVKPMIATNDRLSKLHVFVAHGTNDQVLRFQYATDAVDYLHTRGLQPEFHRYNENHTISSQMLEDAVNWLIKTTDK